MREIIINVNPLRIRDSKVVAWVMNAYESVPKSVDIGGRVCVIKPVCELLCRKRAWNTRDASSEVLRLKPRPFNTSRAAVDQRLLGRSWWRGRVRRRLLAFVLTCQHEVLAVTYFSGIELVAL